MEQRTYYAQELLSAASQIDNLDPGNPASRMLHDIASGMCDDDAITVQDIAGETITSFVHGQ